MRGGERRAVKFLDDDRADIGLEEGADWHTVLKEARLCGHDLESTVFINALLLTMRVEDIGKSAGKTQR